MSMLINSNFFLLWTGQLVSQLGDRFYSMALAWWVLEKTNSPAAMGLFLMATLLPELLFGLVAGGLIDRWNRKAILIAADLIRGLAVLAVTLLWWLGVLEIWHIYLAAAVISLASAFFNPAVMAVIPQLVEQEALPGANALSQMITGLTTVAGPVLGAMLVSLLGYGPVFLLNGISYLASALLEGFITLPAISSQVSENRLLTGIKEGFVFIAAKKPVIVIMLVIGAVHFFFGSLVVSMPFLAGTLSGDGIKNLGYLETAMGLGMILGAVITGRQKMQNLQGSHLFIIILAAGLCFTLLGLAGSLGISSIPPYIAILLFIGMSVSFASVYWRSLLQVYVPHEMAGRVFSVSTMIADVSLPVSFGVFGLALNYFSIPAALAGSGVCLLIISIVLLHRYRETEKI